MEKIVINNRVVEKIEFIDTSDNDRVLGTIGCVGCQECENGYQFKITYKEAIVKD